MPGQLNRESHYIHWGENIRMELIDEPSDVREGENPDNRKLEEFLRDNIKGLDDLFTETCFPLLPRPGALL